MRRDCSFLLPLLPLRFSLSFQLPACSARLITITSQPHRPHDLYFYSTRSSLMSTIPIDAIGHSLAISGPVRVSASALTRFKLPLPRQSPRSWE